MAFVLDGREVFCRVLEHLIRRIEQTPAIDEPFSHIYLEEVFPSDLYDALLRRLPEPQLYIDANERYQNRAAGAFVRSMYQLTTEKIKCLPADDQGLWIGIAAALTAPELQQAMFARLSKDLAFRFGVPLSQVTDLRAYARPTLYRETDGFEIPPHPDTRKKIVTMHLYLPADRSQLGLGTALYRRNLLIWPFGSWQQRFEKVKQFAFQPNSGYAFVVNNALLHKSWHGREKLPAGAGVRNTLLNTFYTTPRENYAGYLADMSIPAADAALKSQYHWSIQRGQPASSTTSK